MGPVNWLAVFLAVPAALLVAALWFGPVFGRERQAALGHSALGFRHAPLRTMALTAALLLVTSAMMGHMFARVGAETLSVKPWLYFMMSGGLAGAFVVPALAISAVHQRTAGRIVLIDAAFWLLAYLAMGLVFFLLKA
jgi:hypothetical protein